MSEQPSEVAVRMGMGAAEAETIADLLMRLPEDVRDRVIDQLWLRSVLIEQRRRTTLAERAAFDVRADRLLQALDPSDESGFLFRCGRCRDERHVALDEWQREGHPACCGQPMLRPRLSAEVTDAVTADLMRGLEEMGRGR